MKKVLFIAAAAIGLFCSCTRELEDRVGNLEQRVDALEKQVKTNVSAIEQLQSAAAKAVTVTSVETTDEGYRIHFSDGKTAEIYNGTIVGVKEIDGVLYWTANGELLKQNGENVRVTGQTPQFKIDNGKWTVSYDGVTWEPVAVDPKEISVKMEETAEEYVFVIDDVKIHVSKEGAFFIKVTYDEKTGYSGDVLTFDYKINGADETTKVYVESKGYEYQLDKENSKLYVTVPKPEANAEYVVLKAVRNSDGKSSSQYITVVYESRYGTFGGVIIKDENQYKEW